MADGDGGSNRSSANAARSRTPSGADGDANPYVGDFNTPADVGDDEDEGAPPPLPFPAALSPHSAQRARQYAVHASAPSGEYAHAVADAVAAQRRAHAHDGHTSGDDEDEFHAADDFGGGRPRAGRHGRAAGLAGRVGPSGSSENSDDDEDDDSGDESENSIIMHSQAAHRHSLSHSALLDQFASPPPHHLLSPPPPALSVNSASSNSHPRSAATPAAPSSTDTPSNGSARRYPLPPGPPPHHSPGFAGAASASAAATPEEAATIEFYLRSALKVRDMQALADLVARASDKRISSELVSQARSVLSDKRAEDRDDQVATLQHYMKAAIEAKSKDACIDVLKKVEPLAATISAGPHRRLYGDFFAQIAECQSAAAELEKEDAQTVSVYLKQGTQLRSREVLQAALTKATSIKHALLDQSVLNQAKQLLSELDSQVMLRNFLSLAVKNRELCALEESIAQAAKLNLSERDAPELADARRLCDELKGQQSNGASGGLSGAFGSGSKERDREREKQGRKAADREQKERERVEKDARHAEKERLKAEKERAKAEKKERDEKDKEREKADHAKIKDKLKWFGSGSKDKKDAASASSSSSSSGRAQLFGGPLSEAMRRNPSGSGLPVVVEECMRFLREHALQEPGLFRVAGNKDLIDHLRALYEEQYQSDDPERETPALTEIHDASGLFKLYFRLVSGCPAPPRPLCRGHRHPQHECAIGNRGCWCLFLTLSLCYMFLLLLLFMCAVCLPIRCSCPSL